MKDKVEKLMNFDGEIEEDEGLEELQQVLCWNNIAFCCSTDKNCLWRDTVLEICGLDKKDYEKLKKKIGKKLLRGEF